MRVILIPFFVVFLLGNFSTWSKWMALAIFVIASLTDMLDGYLARRDNLVTNFGKFMDPLADKLLVCSAMICLVDMSRIPSWIVIIIIGREFVISGFRLIASDNGVVIAANYWGKCKTVCQMFMIIILIAVLYWFFGTELGCSLRATGCNPSMSRAQGINTDRNKVLGLMLSNGLVALSGALLTQYQGFADINMGRGSIVIGLAAVIIGEAIFSRIFRNFALKLLSVVFGSILYYLVLQIVIWMGIDTDLLKMLSALVVAFFLAFPYWKGKYFTKAKQGGK